VVGLSNYAWCLSQLTELSCSMTLLWLKQDVALTGRNRNRTGPPWSVGRPTTDAPGGQHVGPSSRPAVDWPAHLPAALQTTTTLTDDRQQTPACKTTGPLGGPVARCRPNGTQHYWPAVACCPMVSYVAYVQPWSVTDDDDRRRWAKQ